MKIKLLPNKPPKVQGNINAKPIKLIGRTLKARPKTYKSSGAIKQYGPKYKLNYKSPIKIQKR
jgi:hypothetical protein